MEDAEKRCPICRRKFAEHSEDQEKICEIIAVKEFATNCFGFDLEVSSSKKEDM